MGAIKSCKIYPHKYYNFIMFLHLQLNRVFFSSVSKRSSFLRYHRDVYELLMNHYNKQVFLI